MDNHICKFEDRIIKLCEDASETKTELRSLSKRINGSLDDFVKHIQHGTKWRVFIAGTAVTLVVYIVLCAFSYGKQTEIIKSNQKAIERLLEK